MLLSRLLNTWTWDCQVFLCSFSWRMFNNLREHCRQLHNDMRLLSCVRKLKILEISFNFHEFDSFFSARQKTPLLWLWPSVKYTEKRRVVCILERWANDYRVFEMQQLSEFPKGDFPKCDCTSRLGLNSLPNILENLAPVPEIQTEFSV